MPIFPSPLLFDKTAYSTFHSELVRVVDEKEHLLVRGNIPRDASGHFCFEKLLYSLPVKDTHDLIIISLLTFEREDEAAFIHEMEHSPFPHEWLWWQVRAHLPFPTEDLSLLTEQTFEGRRLNFPALVEYVFEMMHTPKTPPRLIYFHCRHGCNRSSALAAAYLMRCGYSLKEAWEKEVAGYLVYEPHELMNFLDLYKQYLQKVEQTSLHQKALPDRS